MNLTTATPKKNFLIIIFVGPNLLRKANKLQQKIDITLYY